MHWPQLIDKSLSATVARKARSLKPPVRARPPHASEHLRRHRGTLSIASVSTYLTRRCTSASALEGAKERSCSRLALRSSAPRRVPPKPPPQLILIAADRRLRRKAKQRQAPIGR